MVEYIVFCVYRRSYLLRPPVIARLSTIIIHGKIRAEKRQEITDEVVPGYYACTKKWNKKKNTWNISAVGVYYYGGHQLIGPTRYRLHKNLYIYPFLLTIFSPINYGPP